MHLDGLTVFLLHGPTQTVGSIMVKCIGVLEDSQAEFQLQHMNPFTRATFESALTQRKKHRIRNALLPFLLERSFLPVVKKMDETFPPGRVTDPSETPYFTPTVRKRQLPVFKADDCKFTMLVHSSLSPYWEHPVTEFVFDWLPLHRNEGALKTAGWVLASAASATSSPGFGGSLEFWLDAEALGLLDSFFQNQESSYIPLIVKAAAKRLSPTWLCIGAAPTGHSVYKTADSFNLQVDDEKGDDGEENEPEAIDNPFISKWVGCSGHFSGLGGGRLNALSHFNKHVIRQKEWPPDEMPSVDQYVASAKACLDDTDVFEFWQASNSAVVKYDEDDDLLGIANSNDGDIQTFFRPGGSGYVLRKIESGHWQPPPVNGCVPYELSVFEYDDELRRLQAEYEGCLDEAKVEATACLLDVTERGDAKRLFPALAYQTRLEDLVFRMRKHYLTDEQERLVDDHELASSEARTLLEMTFTHLGSEAASMTLAILNKAVDEYVTRAKEALLGEDLDGDEQEDLSFFREQIEQVRVATRSESWVLNWIPRFDEDVWRRVVEMDVLFFLSKRGETSSSR